MGTLDELTRLDQEIKVAERRALTNLAEHLREAVRDMPAQSRLALAFVQYAAHFELWATGGDSGLWGAHTLGKLAKGGDQ